MLPLGVRRAPAADDVSDRGRQFPLDDDVVSSSDDRHARLTMDVQANRRDHRGRVRTCCCCWQSSGMMLLAAGARSDDRLPRRRADVGCRSTRSRDEPSQRESAEGALKYFLLGAFSTAFLLYGIALVYGATGSDGPHVDRDSSRPVGRSYEPDAVSASRMLLVGFGFKVGTRSVPHVGSRRLRRLADPDYGVYGRRREDRCIRRIPARLARGVPGVTFELAPHPSGARRRNDGDRQRWGSAAKDSQRHARLLVASRTPGSSSSPSPPTRRRRPRGVLFYLRRVHARDLGAVRRARRALAWRIAPAMSED